MTGFDKKYPDLQEHLVRLHKFGLLHTIDIDVTAKKIDKKKLRELIAGKWFGYSLGDWCDKWDTG